MAREVIPGRKEYTYFNPAKKALFLTLLGEGRTVAASARACGIERVTAYHARARDPEFAKAWDEAEEDGVQTLEEEVRRRAVEGVTREKGIYHQGNLVATERLTEYSDLLLMFLLKAKRPDVYRERQDVVHKGQVSHAHAHVNFGELPVEQLRAFVREGERLLGGASGRSDGAG